MTEEEAKLTVKKPYQSDKAEGLARLDPDTLMRLNVSPGDPVQIYAESGESTVAKAWRADAEDWDKGIARIDSFARQNAGVELGDDVVIVPLTDYALASEIVLSPPEGKAIEVLKGASELVEVQLSRKVVKEGDVIPVKSSLEGGRFGGYGEVVPMVAESVEPEEIVLLSTEESYDVVLKEKPPGNREEEEEGGGEVSGETDTSEDLDWDVIRKLRAIEALSDEVLEWSKEEGAEDLLRINNGRASITDVGHMAAGMRRKICEELFMDKED